MGGGRARSDVSTSDCQVPVKIQALTRRCTEEPRALRSSRRKSFSPVALGKLHSVGSAVYVS